MESQITLAIATAIVPFVAVGSLLWVSRRVAQRRAAGIARQIALTDALHREIGAAAAPLVRHSRLGGWTVSVAVPLEREDTVGAVVRIAHQVFSRLDRVDAPRVRIVLTPREPPGYPDNPASRALSSQSRRPAPSSWAAADGTRGRHLSK
jgi:hypothetical protein